MGRGKRRGKWDGIGDKKRKKVRMKGLRGNGKPNQFSLLVTPIRRQS